LRRFERITSQNNVAAFGIFECRKSRLKFPFFVYAWLALRDDTAHSPFGVSNFAQPSHRQSRTVCISERAFTGVGCFS
jgi:hypothetical protein